MSEPKEIIGGAHEPKDFFDRKIAQQGSTQYIAVTKVIPDDWDYVRITPLEQSDDTVVIRIRCLLRRDSGAQG